MFTFNKGKKTINIVIEDYVIRLVEAHSQHIENAKVITEKPLPSGLIENGKIEDEVQFYSFITDLVKEFSLKNRSLRFYVPNSLVIMRQVEFPSRLNNKEEVIDYFSMEIGKSIHLPFKEPVFDVQYYPDDLEENANEYMSMDEMKQAVLFAASREEIQRYTDIFVDANLKPILADVPALGTYRYFQSMYPQKQEAVYLFAELNVNAMNLSIFHQDEIEFLRYQELDLQLAGWEIDEESNEVKWNFAEDTEIVQGVVGDQVTELERIMNFYRFSMHQGEQQITDIIVLGDHPHKNYFYQQLKSQLDAYTRILPNFEAKLREIDSRFIPAIGLAIEGGSES